MERGDKEEEVTQPNCYIDAEPTWKKEREQMKLNIAYLSVKQENKCAECNIVMTKPSNTKGLVLPGSTRTVDHILPKSAGGTDELANLQLLCQDCNQKKSTFIPEQFRTPKETPKKLAKPRSAKKKSWGFTISFKITRL